MRLHARGYDEVRPAHSALFAHLDREGTRPSELARRAGMTKQSMGELIADLETAGYVVRTHDPSDRRAKLVVLTAAGARLDRAAARAIDEIERTYRHRLAPDRFEALRAALVELRTAAEQPARTRGL